MTVQFKVAGLDIGNSALKAVLGEDNKLWIPTQVKFASQARNTSEEEPAPKNILTKLQVSISSKALSPAYNNVSLLVGECAKGGREMVQGTRKNESDLPIVVALTALAVDAIKDQPKQKNVVAHYAPVFGIPIDYLTKEVKKEFEAKMKGTHVVTIETKGYECQVSLIIEHDAAVPEDAIYVYDEAYDYHGEKTDSPITEQDVFIVGVGQLTTDCGLLNKMKFDPENSFGESFGAATTKDRFIMELNDKLKNRVPRTPYRVDNRAQLEEIIANDYIIKPLNLSVYEEYMAVVKADAFSLVDKLLGKMTAKRIFAERYIAIGGALNLYKHHFINFFESEGYHFEIPETPEFATARGLFKYGMSERGFRKFMDGNMAVSANGKKN